MPSKVAVKPTPLEIVSSNIKKDSSKADIFTLFRSIFKRNNQYQRSLKAFDIFYSFAGEDKKAIVNNTLAMSPDCLNKNILSLDRQAILFTELLKNAEAISSKEQRTAQIISDNLLTYCSLSNSALPKIIYADISGSGPKEIIIKSVSGEDLKFKPISPKVIPNPQLIEAKNEPITAQNKFEKDLSIV